MYLPLSLPRKALLRQWSFLVTDALVESVLAEVSTRFSTLPAPRKMNEKRRLFKEEQQRKKAPLSKRPKTRQQNNIMTWIFSPMGRFEAAIHAAENVHIGQLSAMFALVFFILAPLGSAK